MRRRALQNHRPRPSDLVAAAVAYAQLAHRGERLKFVEGVYYTHVKAVSRRMHTPEEKVVALLHDVVENRVKRELGKFPNPAEEMTRIKEILEEIERYFKSCGHNVSALIPDIDMLTKRVTDKDSYEGYIIRLSVDAETRGVYRTIRVKLADLHDNMNPRRNPALSQQTAKDRERLVRYGRTVAYLTHRFPNIYLRSARPANRRLLPGRPGVKSPTRKERRFVFED